MRKHQSRRATAGVSLVDDGGMAERIRTFDWSRTPLGPMDRWPSRLANAVDDCLESSQVSFVWWGPDLINVYNDAQVLVLGERHPAALGRPAREVWPDAWPWIVADLDGVLTRGTPVIRERAQIDLERAGRPEPHYFTYTFCPIWDGDGRIGGVFCIASDETERVLADRERDRGAMAVVEAKAASEAGLARWQSVIAGMHEGVILADAAGHLLDWNRAALNIHGHDDVGELLVHLTDIATTFQLTTPDGEPLPFDRWPMSRLLAGEEFKDERFHLRRPGTGLHRVVNYSGALIRDAADQISLALLTLRTVGSEGEVRTSRFPPDSTVVPGESEDQRVERAAEDVARNVESLLHDMGLSVGERAFCKTVGEGLVDQAVDAFVKAQWDHKGYDGSCIAGSVAVALMIVREPA